MRRAWFLDREQRQTLVLQVTHQARIHNVILADSPVLKATNMSKLILIGSSKSCFNEIGINNTATAKLTPFFFH